MAQKSERWIDNATGKFYTDKTCILCCLCADLAPQNFRESMGGDHDVVYKQPATEQENQQCIEALQACPVEAIGQDGV
ncbi:MAG TPA: ferredoxin [Acidobacteriota bacterium]